MRLLQRYILFEVLRVFGFVLSVVTVLLVFVGVFREVSESGLGPFQILQILPFIVPSLLPFTIPATLLLTVCIVYGRIAGNNEIAATKAAGINVLSLLWPSFFLGAMLSVGSLLLTDQVIPMSVGKIQQIITDAMEDIFLDVLRRHNQMNDPANGVAITVMGVEGKKLIKPTFRFTPRDKSAVMIQAQEATIEFDLSNQQVLLHLVRGHIDIPGQKRVWFEKESRPFPWSSNIQKPKPRHLSIREIRTQISEIADEQKIDQQNRDIQAAIAFVQGDFDRFNTYDFQRNLNREETFYHDYCRLNTELHSRFALSCSCFFFVLLGTPFSILKAQRQFLTSFAFVFFPILVVYYPIVLGMMNLSKTGTVNPAWAMWIGNAGLFVAGCFALRKSLKN